MEVCFVGGTKHVGLNGFFELPQTFGLAVDVPIVRVDKDAPAAATGRALRNLAPKMRRIGES